MTDQTTTLYCDNHPDVPTSLRCNRCEKPICIRCAVATPVGYRCKECISGQQRVFDTSIPRDYPVAFGIAAVIAYLGSLLAPTMMFLTIFIAPVFGVIVAEVVRVAVKKRRSRQLYWVVVVAVILGSLPLAVEQILDVIKNLGIYQEHFLKVYTVSHLSRLIWLGIHMFMVASTAYYRLRGIVR